MCKCIKKDTFTIGMLNSKGLDFGLLGRQELLATSRFLCCGRAGGRAEVISPMFCVFVDYDLTLVPIGSIVFLWVPIGSYGFLWVPIGSYRFLCVPMGFYGLLWVLMGS